MKVNAVKRGGKYFITLYGVEYEVIVPVTKRKKTSKAKKTS